MTKNQTLQEFQTLPALINVGTRMRKCKVQTTNKLTEETNNICPSSPRIRGYNGFVPQKKFGYGIPDSQIDASHLQPNEDKKKMAAQKESVDPCLGYQGCVP